MKSIESVALATWMVEHLAIWSHNQALSGDLLKEFRPGRSAVWYCRQALSAIGVGVVDPPAAQPISDFIVNRPRRQS